MIRGSFPARALAKLMDLIIDDPRGDRWRGIPAERHAHHGIGHFVQGRDCRVDGDSGLDPYIHAAARALFAAEVEMDKETK